MKKSIGITGGQQRFKQLLASMILALIITPAAIGAGVYKWVDAEGKVHYSSERPQDAEAERMQLNVPEPATSPDNAADEDKNTDLSEEDKALQEREAYCKNERDRLRSIEKNAAIYEKNSKGVVQKLSAEERNQRMNKIKANIEQYCK